MRKILLLCILIAAIASPAQQTVKKDSGTVTVSGAAVGVAGGAFQLNNDLGMVTNGFEVVITGTPSTVSVVIKGCMRGATCDTLDTYTTVANSNRKPTISVAYDYFEISASWTGGSSPTVRVNRTATLARSGGGGGTGAVSSVFGQTGVVPDLNGDAATSGSSAVTLATVNSNTGSIGDATHSLTLNIDGKGRILSATANVISASVAWGAITGTLASQTDLQNALNLKAPIASPTFTGTVTFPSAVATGAGAGNFEYSGGTFNTTSQAAGSTRIGADTGGVSSFNEQGLLNVVLPVQNGSLILNDTVTGTLANGLVCVSSGTSKALKCPTSTTNGVVGIAVQGSGTSGSVVVRSSGEQQCVFENTSVVGNWVIPGTGTAGDCRDSGTASTSAAPTGAIGVAIEAGAAGSRKVVFMGSQGGASTPTLNAVLDPTAAKTFAVGVNKVTMSSTTGVPFAVNGNAKFGSNHLFEVFGNSANAFYIDENFGADFFGALNCQDTTCRITDSNAGGFEFRNNSTGNLIAGIDDVSAANAAFYVNLTATSALTAGQVVKIDTANASKVVVAATTDTQGGVAIGFVTNSATTAANNARVAFGGIITTPLLGTGTCAIGDYILVDTTTAGRVKCSTAFAPGSLGKALTSQASVGSAVTVDINIDASNFFGVNNNAANTAAAGMTLDMSGATGATALKVPVIAGATAGANGVIDYDSTNANTHLRANNADAIAAAEAAAITANTIPKSGSSTVGLLAASSITDNGTTVATTEAVNIGSSAQFGVNASGLPTKSNNFTTAGQGFPVILGITSQKAETTSADANVLTVTPPSAVGSYRVCVAISVASATSGIISWTLSWTDSNAAAQTNIAQFLVQHGTAAPNTTFTTSAAGNYHGCSEIDTNAAGANIVVKWVGGGTSSDKMSAWVEKII